MSVAKLPTVSTPDLELVNGVPMVSSLNIAESFGKEHRHVLRDINALLPNLPEGFRESNFGLTQIETPMPTGGVRKDPAFNLTRDAFTLLAMGFTGKQALAWKLRYIEAFNAMEGKLLAQQQLAITEARREGIAIGAKATAALAPHIYAQMMRVLRYKSMGLSYEEIAKLCDCVKGTVAHMVARARNLGLEQ